MNSAFELFQDNLRIILKFPRNFSDYLKMKNSNKYFPKIYFQKSFKFFKRPVFFLLEGFGIFKKTGDFLNSKIFLKTYLIFFLKTEFHSKINYLKVLFKNWISCKVLNQLFYRLFFKINFNKISFHLNFILQSIHSH